MKGFVAAALAIAGTLVLFSYDDVDNLSSSPRPRRRMLGLSIFNDPKGVAPRLSSDVSMGESAAMNELADINNWGNPAKLTSFGYKWKDDKCSNANTETSLQPQKKRAALCLYGGISSYPMISEIVSIKEGLFDSSAGTTAINDLSNVDWAAALYDKNLLPEGDFELDLFIHDQTYFCTLARSFDGTRFTLRSIIVESNERHMNELERALLEELMVGN